MESDVISIRGLSATGFHGVYPAERASGQRFVVDLDLALATPVASDQLAETVDYSQICTEVVDVIAGAPVNLIETLAENIASQVLSHQQLTWVRVKVHKPEAPMDVEFENVSFTITRRK